MDRYQVPNSSIGQLLMLLLGLKKTEVWPCVVASLSLLPLFGVQKGAVLMLSWDMHCCKGS